jgi:hypothetical protein
LLSHEVAAAECHVQPIPFLVRWFGNCHTSSAQLRKVKVPKTDELI